MFKPVKIRINGGLLRGGDANRIAAGAATVISWAAVNDARDALQIAYHIEVKCANILKWSSSWVDSQSRQAVYEGEELPPGKESTFILNCGIITIPKAKPHVIIFTTACCLCGIIPKAHAGSPPQKISRAEQSISKSILT